MPLPALNWRFVGMKYFASGSIQGAHAALADLGARTTYPDGTARTPGSGSAWTWTLRTASGVNTAVTGVPPLNPLGWAYILAGQDATLPVAGARLAPDTGKNGAIVLGMNRNTVGAWSGWNSATPFTTAGTFTGYWNVTNTVSSLAYSAVLLWESQEACFVQYAADLNGPGYNSSGAVFGAWVDPLEYVVGTTCETDNRLYAMSGSGAVDSTWIPTNWAATNSATTGFAGSYSSTANAAHTGYIVPGGVTVNPAVRYGLASSWPSLQAAALDGTPVGVPFSLSTLSGAAIGAYLGEARSMAFIPDQISGVGVLDKDGRKGWVMGYSTSRSGDCVLLKE